jgi:hypothetical protein
MKERLYDIPTRDQALDAVKQIVADCWLEAHNEIMSLYNCKGQHAEDKWLIAFLDDGYDRPLLDGH